LLLFKESRGGRLTRDKILDYDEFALHVLKQELAKRFSYKWKCKNGSLVNVEDMTDSHLEHAINILEDYLARQEVEREAYADYYDRYD
jgi:hypothetical protein